MAETITHIVLFKYRSSITWSDFEAHFDSFTKLRTKCLRNGKPYMKSMRMGKNRSWEPFSKGMTHGFVLEFESQDDLDYYLTQDSVHREFSRLAAPYVEDSVVGDIKDGVLFGPAAPHPLSKSSGAHAGSCHCGALAWTAKLDKAEHVLCHWCFWERCTMLLLPDLYEPHLPSSGCYAGQGHCEDFAARGRQSDACDWRDLCRGQTRLGARFAGCYA